MVKRFLITTAEKSTWVIGRPVLFLGEWCKVFSKRKDWITLDCKTAQYHWDDRTLLYQDFCYLDELYERLLPVCAEGLNNFHSTNYSVRFWRILVGPWLYMFIQVAFDRWQMVKKVIEENDLSGTIVIDGIDEQMIPKNYAEFSRQAAKDLWNHWLYSKIIRKIGGCSVTIAVNDKTSDVSSKKNGFNFLLVKIAGKMLHWALTQYNLLLQNNKCFFYPRCFDRKSQMELEVFMGQLPSFYRPVDAPDTLVDMTKRNELKFEFAEGNEFESFLGETIFIQIPRCYVEGFSLLHSVGQKQNWPKAPKKIITSSAIIGDDVFKLWTAEKVEIGTKLFVSQHGGHYGVGKWNSSEKHEVAISDVFLSWGWSGKSVKKIDASKLVNIEKRLWHDPVGRVVLVQGLAPRYSYWQYSIPIASQWEGYINDQIRFVDCLPVDIRNELLVRLYSSDYEWSQEERWLSKFPNMKFHSLNKPIDDAIKQSRIFIGTYNATTFLETFSANIPTILFWDKEKWEIRGEAEVYFDMLYEKGILHYSPEAAANKVAEIWPDIDGWWFSAETQLARINFINCYANITNKWKSNWVDLLNSEEKIF